MLPLFIMEVLLDTNFILSCVRKRIDFLDQLEEQGFVVKLPHEVFEELKDIRKDAKHDDRVAIDFAFELFEKRKVKKMALGKGKVDVALIERGKTGTYIATLDKAIQREIENVVIVFDAQNRVGKK